MKIKTKSELNILLNNISNIIPDFINPEVKSHIKILKYIKNIITWEAKLISDEFQTKEFIGRIRSEVKFCEDCIDLHLGTDKSMILEIINYIDIINDGVIRTLLENEMFESLENYRKYYELQGIH